MVGDVQRKSQHTTEEDPVTLTEGDTATLTLASNSIVKLPEIQHDYGKNVTAYYKNEKGYSLYGGDLAVGNETYTLAAKVSASSGDFTRQYATGRPNFTVGGTEKNTYAPATDTGEIRLIYPKWEDMEVTVTLQAASEEGVADVLRMFIV